MFCILMSLILLSKPQEFMTCEGLILAMVRAILWVAQPMLEIMATHKIARAIVKMLIPLTWQNLEIYLIKSRTLIIYIYIYNKRSANKKLHKKCSMLLSQSVEILKYIKFINSRCPLLEVSCGAHNHQAEIIKSPVFLT